MTKSISEPFINGNEIKEIKNTINKNMSIMSNVCRFLSDNGTKPSFINVKKVTIPIKIHKNEDKIIQLKFLIILNILNNH